MEEREVNGLEIYLGAESIAFTGELREREAISEWPLSSSLSSDCKVMPFIDTRHREDGCRGFSPGCVKFEVLVS